MDHYEFILTLLPNIVISGVSDNFNDIFLACPQMNLHIIFFREFFITMRAKEFRFVQMGKLDMLIKIPFLGETGLTARISIVANEGSFTGVSSHMVEIFAHRQYGEFTSFMPALKQLQHS